MTMGIMGAIGGIGVMIGDALRDDYSRGEMVDVLTGYKREIWGLYGEFLTSVQNGLSDYGEKFITAEAWVTERVVQLRQKAYAGIDTAEDWFDIALAFTVLKDQAIIFNHDEAAQRLEMLQHRAAVLNEKMYRGEVKV